MSGIISTLKNTFNRVSEVSGITTNKEKIINLITKFSPKHVLSGLALTRVLTTTLSIASTKDMENKMPSSEITKTEMQIKIEQVDKNNKLSGVTISQDDLSKYQTHLIKTSSKNMEILSSEVINSEVRVKLDTQKIDKEKSSDLVLEKGK